MYHLFFIHLSVDGHSGCFHVLAVVNSAAVNTGVHASFWIRVFIFSRCMPSSGIAGSYGNSVFSFLKACSCNIAICSNMDGPRRYHTKWSKPDKGRQIPYVITYMWNLKKNHTLHSHCMHEASFYMLHQNRGSSFLCILVSSFQQRLNSMTFLSIPYPVQFYLICISSSQDLHYQIFYLINWCKLDKCFKWKLESKLWYTSESKYFIITTLE